ncbi:MAG TPA: GNAT family N-acetyltransferase [Acidimicrobiia bacterium]
MTTGTRVGARGLTMRPIAETDAPLLRELFDRMSPESRYYRFHSPVQKVSDRWLEHLTHVDHCAREALIAFVDGKIVGVARYAAMPDDPTTAELAIVVADAWQRRGIATALLRALGTMAAARGVARWTGSVIAENRAVVALVDTLTDDVDWGWEDGRRRVSFELGRPARRGRDAVPCDARSVPAGRVSPWRPSPRST